MSEERRKILEMLAAGKIDPDDADRLLERLGARASRGHGAAHATARSGGQDDATEGDEADASTGFVLVREKATSTPIRHRLKFLRIVVTGSDEETVNIRIPLAFIRTGLKLSTMVPQAAQKRLMAEGIDLTGLSALEGEELIEALRELKVDIDGPKGETVRIFCE